MTETLEVPNALKFFWLNRPVNDKNIISKKFKKLSMKYHPDRWWTNDDFIKLTNYRDLLIDNFDEINQIDFENTEVKKENIVKNQETNDVKIEKESILEKILIKIIVTLIWKPLFFILEKVDFYLMKLIYFLWEIFLIFLKYFFKYLIIFLVFLIPSSFISTTFIQTIEPKYYESWYITDWKIIWSFENWNIRELWPIEYISFVNIDTAYWIEKLKERQIIFLWLIFKLFFSYFIMILIYSFIYLKWIKPFINKEKYKKMRALLSHPIKAKIFYFIYLYIFVYFTFLIF